MSTAAAPPLSREEVRQAARAVGFDVVGCAPAAPLDGRELRSYLDEGRAGEMRPWLERSLPARLDPVRALAGARTVIVVGLAYGRPSPGPVAGYARGVDYHVVHRRTLVRLGERLRQMAPGMKLRAGADSWPVMEKVWAVRCGLGVIGQHGLLVTREHGSWLTLGALLIDRELDAYDAPATTNDCGACAACLTACPTGALLGGGRLDARRCLSYQTIEQRGRVPDELRTALRGKLHGCDECQQVCPWNAGVTPESPDRRRTGDLDMVDVARLTRERFAASTAGTALERTGYDRLRRNALLAAEPAPRMADVARELLSDPDPLVRDAAAWLLARIG